MLGIIIWIIIIYIIVVKVKAQQNDKSSTTKRNIQSTSNKSLNSSSYSPSKPATNTQRSSYYREDKVDSYKRMNADHVQHDGDEGDLVDTIGYVKCPHCGASVSKKSDTCFMCDKPLN